MSTSDNSNKNMLLEYVDSEINLLQCIFKKGLLKNDLIDIRDILERITLLCLLLLKPYDGEVLLTMVSNEDKNNDIYILKILTQYGIEYSLGVTMKNEDKCNLKINKKEEEYQYDDTKLQCYKNKLECLIRNLQKCQENKNDIVKIYCNILIILFHTWEFCKMFNFLS